MVKVREQALKLRLRGYSYNEIHKKLHVPKSTLSGWFSRLVLSKNAQKRIDGRKNIGTEILIKRNRMQTHVARRRVKMIQRMSARTIGKLSKRELVILGAALYWGEGYKRIVVKDGKERTSHIIRLTNTDPHIIRAFILFLQTILKIPHDKMNVAMRLYQHINEQEARTYWSRSIGLPEKNFKKTTYLVSRASLGKRSFTRLPYGTIALTVNDTKRFHSIIGFIEGLKNFLST